MNGSDFKKAFEADFPPHLAYEWDNVGLMVGTLNKPIKTVLVTLDVTKDVIKKAVSIGADLIISHHPLIFSPIRRLSVDTYKGAMIETLIKEGIAVYSAHTNYDLANGGMNDMLASKLAMKNVAILEMTDETHGIGRIGELPSPLPLEEAVTTIKRALDIDDARYIGNQKEKTVKTLAISGGSGADHAFMAKKKGADLYLTGDVSYHEAHDMMQMGLRVLDIGHTAEKHFKTAIRDWLVALDDTLKVDIYAPSQNPFQQV
ncbi:MAG: Nif3-like dinuclear metal center hexameric protein [Candidatus Izemoplasmataceae bacterium]